MSRLEALQSLLAHTLLQDRYVLHRQYQKLLDSPVVNADDLDRFEQKLQTSVARYRLRADAVPKAITFPDSLPVSQRRQDIAEAIEKHQVVIIAGETGSGKTTQLPKICLQLGRGVAGLIGHTQPRRIAARTVASRIQQELGQQDLVGYKVRFTDQTGERSLIKLMTDGILLAETRSDRFLNQYDTIIIDEAHERSLNIDFLMGYLKQLLPKRPDLKVIITSATIDTERLAKHFSAPVIEVSGRSFPVDIRYRPREKSAGQFQDLADSVVDAVAEAVREGPGDILAFLPGERDIREVAEAVRKSRYRGHELDVLPLYSRLSVSQQQQVFQDHTRRRLVLATNVAETSLTVPGIRYVIDSGLARISRYSYRSKMQRLPIEDVSQASCNQRAGRCGRTGPGICYRLYGEDDYQQRSEFTDPEIQRTNLANVILQMSALKLGDVRQFPFVDAPDERFVKDGYRLLRELDAIDEHDRITPLGRQLARYPLDPRLGRMIEAASQNGALHEVLIIAAGLSVQDPRERPAEFQQAADQAHEQFADKQSDFMSLYRVWQWFAESRQGMSHSQLRKLCRKQYIAYMRMVEWREIYGQLKQLVQESGYRLNSEDASYEAIHQSLLSGLLGHVGNLLEEKHYQGVRNARFMLFPGSGLFNKPPKWIIAADIVETTRVYARMCARIEPQWIEQVAEHLLHKSAYDPYWHEKSESVMAFERKTLFGLLVNPKNRIQYASRKPTEAREIFLQEGLVHGRLKFPLPECIEHNLQQIEAVRTLEDKRRRQDILLSEEAIVSLYHQRIPLQINTGAAFRHWWRKRATESEKQQMFFAQQDLMQHDAEQVTVEQFPDVWHQESLALKLDYQFSPGDGLDGVTVNIPLLVLPQLSAEPFAWLVPGLIEEKLVLMIKALPKALRKQFVPAPQYARAVLDRMQGQAGVFEALVADALARIGGVSLSPDCWQGLSLPEYLIMHFVVRDDEGNVIDRGDDLTALQQRCKSRVEGLVSHMSEAEDRLCTDAGDWVFGELPHSEERQSGGVRYEVYPALESDGQQVCLKWLPDEYEAGVVSREGLIALYMQKLARDKKYILKNLPHIDRTCLQAKDIQSCDSLKQDIVYSLFGRLFVDEHGFPASAQEYQQVLDTAGPQLVSGSQALAELLAIIMSARHTLSKQLKRCQSPGMLHALVDIETQLGNLLYEGFVLYVEHEWLQQYPRYLQAISIRLEKLLQGDIARDEQLTRELATLTEQYETRSQQARYQDQAEQYRWMLEEYRVSVFAQKLGTRVPVSAKRLAQLWES